MKKLLTAALFALGISTLSAAPASASAFGLFYCRGCCWGCCCGCNVCLRPYNAFTPVVSGCLCCDGCVPFCGTGGAAGGFCGPVGSGPLCSPGCDGCYGQLPEVGGLPAAGPEVGMGSMPAAAQAPVMVYGVPPADVSAAGFRPPFYPGSGVPMPLQGAPITMPAPGNK
jgi:hypothetical protein